jgi:hypothetical protein
MISHVCNFLIGNARTGRLKSEDQPRFSNPGTVRVCSNRRVSRQTHGTLSAARVVLPHECGSLNEPLIVENPPLSKAKQEARGPSLEGGGRV